MSVKRFLVQVFVILFLFLLLIANKDISIDTRYILVGLGMTCLSMLGIIDSAIASLKE